MIPKLLATSAHQDSCSGPSIPVMCGRYCHGVWCSVFYGGDFHCSELMGPAAW